MFVRRLRRSSGLRTVVLVRWLKLLLCKNVVLRLVPLVFFIVRH
mgnify:CR=1 FL=1